MKEWFSIECQKPFAFTLVLLYLALWNQHVPTLDAGYTHFLWVLIGSLCNLCPLWFTRMMSLVLVLGLQHSIKTAPNENYDAQNRSMSQDLMNAHNVLLNK